MSAVGSSLAQALMTAERASLGKTDPNRKFLVERVLLIIILAINLALSVSLFALATNYTGDPTGVVLTVDEAAEDISVVWARVLLMVLTVSVALISLLMTAPPFTGAFATRLTICLGTLALGLFFGVLDLRYPDVRVQSLNIVCLVLRCLAIVIIIEVVFRSGLNRVSNRVQRYTSLRTDLEKQPQEAAFPILLKLVNWLDLQQVRRKMREHMRRGRLYFVFFCLVIYLLYFGNFVFEFRKILSYESPLFDPAAFDGLNNDTRTRAEFGSTPLPGGKVVLVVIDGLRADFVYRNADFNALVTDPSFARDALMLNASAQLPSMSVPNWVSLITGAPPELTGVLGNLLIPETQFDSVFRQARLYGLMRGLTGSPWFGQIVQTQLPYLRGDGTVSTATNADPNAKHETADAADNIRGEILLQAVNTTDPPYQFFLAHFSDVDIQGHCCGVSTQWNTENSYDSAVSNKTRILRRLVAAVDTNTTVVIVADHGHVLRGGHGGVAPELRAVPLIFYKKGSNLRSTPYTGPRFPGNGPGNYSNLDISNTVNALLGLPVPRGSLGRVVDDALALVPPSNWPAMFRDLARQKQLVIGALCARLSRIPEECATHPLLTANISANTPEQNIQLVDDLLAFYYGDLRGPAIQNATARNFAVTSVVVLVLVLLFLLVLQRSTFAAPLSFVRCRPQTTRLNVVAALWALAVVASYFIIVTVAYVLLYRRDGYDLWDSTVIHTPQVIPRFVLTALLPGVLGLFVVLRLSMLPYKKWGRECRGRQATLGQRVAAALVHVLADARHNFGNALGLMVLVRTYLLFFTTLAVLVVFTLCSTYTFILPLAFRVPFVRLDNWAYRFQMLSMQAMTIPLAIGAVVLNFLLPRSRISESHMDEVYMLRVDKYEAQLGSTAASAPMLEILRRERVSREFEMVGKASELLDVSLE